MQRMVPRKERKMPLKELLPEMSERAIFQFPDMLGLAWIAVAVCERKD